MTTLAGIATLAFIAAGTIVGIRLAGLAKRTQGTAERNIGWGLLCICAVSYPLGLVTPMEAVPEIVRRGAFAVAMTGLAAGSIFILLFVYGVFRRDVGWALWLLRISAAAWVGIGAMSYWTAASAPVDALSSVEGPRFLLRQLLMLTLYGWSAVESTLYWSKMKKRRALGLAEPEVVNRVGLWSVAGAASLASVSMMTVTGLAGRNPLEDPTALLVIGISGLVSSASLVLAFLPPSSYLAWLRRTTA